MPYKEIVSLVVPIFLLGWISMIAVILPASSGEKIGFVTALELTLIFMMGTVDTHLVAALRGEQMPLITNAYGFLRCNKRSKYPNTRHVLFNSLD